MNTYYYCKTKKSGKLTKPIKIVADNKDAAQKIIRDNNPKGETLFFDTIEEYVALIERIKFEEEKSKQDQIDKLSDISKKVFQWIKDEHIFSLELTADTIKQFNLENSENKEYYQLYSYERGVDGWFLTKKQLIDDFQESMLDHDAGGWSTILEVSTMKEVVPVIKEIEFTYKK